MHAQSAGRAADRTRILALVRASVSMAWATVMAATLALPGVALAAPSAADRETARTLMDQGREQRDKGNLAEALKRFQAANEIMHVPTTALEVAKSQVALGLLVEARDTVAGLRQIPSKHDSALFKEARSKAEELDASLNGRVPAVTITLKGGTPGEEAELAIDGIAVPIGVLGLPRSVNPGHHVMTAKTTSSDGKAEIDLREGEQKPVEITMIVTRAPAPPPETAPIAGENPGEPAKKSHSPTIVTFAGIGVAGAGVIAGTITGVLAISKKSSLVSACPNHTCGPQQYSQLDSANTFATISDIAFAVAGAGAAVAAVTLIIGHGGPSSKQPSTGLTVSPWIAGSAAGLAGTF